MMSFAGGERKFRCRLPNKHESIAGDGNAGGGDTKLSESAKAKAHFINSKLAPLRGTCRKLQKDYWFYDVCFGRKVVQYHLQNDMRFSLGEHVKDADELFSNGTVRETYRGGTDRRTLHIFYVCGSSDKDSRMFDAEEATALHYTITISGPAFCTWREEGGRLVAHSSSDGHKKLLASSLLEELRGSCVNVTQGWWTYEYCYPKQLVQYHLAGDGDHAKRDPEHLMGEMTPGDPDDPNAIEMSVVRPKTSIANPRDRRAPPSNHAALRQRLEGGAVCDETGRARRATVNFQCPTNWQQDQRPAEARFASIDETALCEYEVQVYTTLLCGHRKFLPTLPAGKQTIQCAAEPKTN